MAGPFIRLGDKVRCAKHGNNAIAGADATLIVDGKPVASQQATIDNI